MKRVWLVALVILVVATACSDGDQRSEARSGANSSATNSTGGNSAVGNSAGGNSAGGSSAGVAVSGGPASTLAATNATTLTASGARRAPNGRIAPNPATTAAELARQIETADRVLRSPSASLAELADAGHLQQVAYRKLAADATLDAAALAALAAPLRRDVETNMRARRAFSDISSGYADKVPAWEVIEPEPANALLAYYKEAQAATGIGWQYMAAINYIETGFGRI